MGVANGHKKTLKRKGKGRMVIRKKFILKKYFKEMTV